VLFGFSFRGVDTDFAPFERLATYYQAVDSQFSQPNKKALRSFLRNAQINELESIPALPPTDLAMTYDMLQSRITAAEVQIKTLEEAISGLRSCVHVLSDPSKSSPSDLRPLMNRLHGLVQEESALDRAEDIRTIIGNSFGGARTHVHALKDVVRWAHEARNFDQALSKVLASRKVSEARSKIAEVLDAERAAAQLMVRLTAIAKIEGSHFTEGRSRKVAATRLREASLDGEGLFNHDYSIMPSLHQRWKKCVRKVCFR
jgi:hypothetical protein